MERSTDNECGTRASETEVERSCRHTEGRESRTAKPSSSRSSAQQSHVNAKTSRRKQGSFSAVEPARKSFRFGMHVNAKNCSARLHIHLSPPLRPDIARDHRCRIRSKSWRPATAHRKFASISRPGAQILSYRRILDPFSSPQVSCSSSLHLASRFVEDL